MILDGKPFDSTKLASNILLGTLCISFLGAMLPNAITLLQNFVSDLFIGTLFENLFSSGIVVYGVLAIAMVMFVLTIFSDHRKFHYK